MGGETEWEGRLEVCLGQRWGSVSSRASDGWPAANTQVVCRDLGYETSNTTQSTSRSCHKYFQYFHDYMMTIFIKLFLGENNQMFIPLPHVYAR